MTHGGRSAEIELAADVPVPGRPFAEPRCTSADLVVLDELAVRLARRAHESLRTDGWERWRDDAADHLLLVPSWERLEATTEAPAVGFFGQLRPDPDHDFPPHLERSVAEAGVRNGWLLAYFNVRFLKRQADGTPRYGNLVLVTTRDAAGVLAYDGDHVEAVRRSPGTYRSIRIHRLVVTGCPIRRPEFRVRETLYIDFALSPPWRAIRRAAQAS